MVKALHELAPTIIAIAIEQHGSVPPRFGKYKIERDSERKGWLVQFASVEAPIFIEDEAVVRRETK